MFARAAVSLLCRVCCLLGVGIALPLPASTLAGQSTVFTITPGSGTYLSGSQLAVHVEFCITDPNEHFWTNGTVTVNGVEVAWGQPLYPAPGCYDFRWADVNITTVEGTTTLTASIVSYVGEVQDVFNTWSESVWYTSPPPPSVTVDVTPHNGHNRSAALCAVACFDAVTGYTTPAYWTFDTPRAVTLFYSSGQVQSRHTVQLTATLAGGAEPPGAVSMRLRRPDGSYVTLTNGQTDKLFPGGWGTRRLAVQFEDSTLTTGAHAYTAVARGHWGSTIVETTVPIRVLLINERTSPYGAGWSVAGTQRVIQGYGDSLVTWDGAGTVQLWRRTSCTSNTCTYQPPAGEFDQLQRLGTPTEPLYIQYLRTAVDGTKLTSDWAGRLLYVDDVFGNRVRYVWRDGERLDSIVDPAGKAIVFGYDGSNRLSWIRDVPGNRTTNFTISAQNNLIEIQDAVGGKPFQQATYDAFHRLLARLDRRGARWSSSYDFAGKLATDSTPGVTADSIVQRLVTLYTSSETSVLQAPNGADIAMIKPPTGSTRTLLVDAFGALLQVLTPAAEFVRYVRNAHGQVVEAMDSTGHKSFAWSGPRLWSAYNPSTGAAVYFEWNTATNRITRRYGNGTVEVRNFYDPGGFRLDSTKVTNEAATRFTYDSRGRVLTVTDPRGHVGSSFYDGNPWLNTDSVKSGSRRTLFRYDATAGRPSTVTKPGGRVDSTFYDALNRVTRTGGPLGYSVTYAYGDSLNLTQVTDPRGQASRVEKNLIGWDTLTVNTLNQTSRYEYDRAGRVKRWTNRRNQLTRFDYDSLGRLTSRILADGRITNLLYGPTRMLAVNEEGSDTIRWSGDTTFEIAMRGGVVYTARTVYDRTARDHIVAVWRTGQNILDVRYDLDSAGRVQRIVPFNGSPDTLTYAPDGMHTGIKWHGAWSLAYQFRPRHDLARAVYPFGLEHFGGDFIQDTLGQVVQQVQGGGGEFENYSYDARGRLTAFARYLASPLCPVTDTLSEYGTPCTTGTQLVASDAFTYDAAGNRTDKNALVDAANRLDRFDGDSMLYDPDGNLVRKFRIADSSVFNQRLFWNSAGQLDSALTTRSGSTQMIRLGYDGYGRRVRKSAGTNTVRYVYSGSRVVGEYDGAGAQLRQYTYLPGMDNPHALLKDGWARYYYVTDGRGNVRALMNWSGSTIEAQYRYTPFGDTVSTAGYASLSNVRFAGREFDSETGLYYNRARYYDPKMARFVSEDAGDLSAVNRYTYAANDPVNGRDPSGRWCELREGGIQAAQAPPVVPGSSPTPSASNYDGEYLYCEDLSASDLWTIEAYLAGTALGLRSMWQNAGWPTPGGGTWGNQCRGGFGDQQCTNLAERLAELTLHENELCRRLGVRATQRFQAGRFRYNEGYIGGGETGPVGRAAVYQIWRVGTLTLSSHLFPGGLHAGALAETIAHEEYHFMYLGSSIWYGIVGHQRGDPIYNAGETCGD